MKAVFVLSLLVSFSAYADTLQVLNDPQPLPAHQLGTATPCAGIGSAADGSIFGACRFTTGGNCGRYCQPAKTFYIATWDQNGLNAILGPVCGYLSAGFAGRQTTTYVAPGQQGWFIVNLTAPDQPGTYRLHLRPLIEGVTWLEDSGVFVDLVVN